MTQVKAKVFKDDKGNRFIFPEYMYKVSGDHIPFDSYFWQMRSEFRMAIGIEMEDGWFEFEDSTFLYAKAELTHPGFLHGAATAYFFEGPIFQSAFEEQDDKKV